MGDLPEAIVRLLSNPSFWTYTFGIAGGIYTGKQSYKARKASKGAKQVAGELAVSSQNLIFVLDQMQDLQNAFSEVVKKQNQTESLLGDVQQELADTKSQLDKSETRVRELEKSVGGLTVALDRERRRNVRLVDLNRKLVSRIRNLEDRK